MNPYYSDDLVRLFHGDAEAVARTLDSGSVQTIVTSPPYFGLRDYGEAGQIGAEDSLDAYVGSLVSLFRELRRVLADDGTLWLNLGDSYGAGKQLLGVPWEVAFALRADGWVLRSDIIWVKPNPMPEAVTDRPTKSHEHLFLLVKSPTYYYDAAAISEQASGTDERRQFQRAKEIARDRGLTEAHISAIRSAGITDAGKAVVLQAGSGLNSQEVNRLAKEAKAALGGYYREFLMSATKNRRDVWEVPTTPFAGAHFAVYPPELIRPCILAGSRRGDTVLDPFSGSGTTGAVATEEGRRYVGIDLSRDYLDLSLRTRFQQPVLDLTGGVA